MCMHSSVFCWCGYHAAHEGGAGLPRYRYAEWLKYLCTLERVGKEENNDKEDAETTEGVIQRPCDSVLTGNGMHEGFFLR